MPTVDVTATANTVDFWIKFCQVYPLAIRRVQTDNGAEFLGAFEAHLKQTQTPHSFTYPRCPKVNGCIERYQRTLSEEFLQVHEFAIRQPREFCLQLADYLVFYNCERAHQALALQTPMAYLLAQGGLSKMSVTSTVGRLNPQRWYCQARRLECARFGKKRPSFLSISAILASPVQCLVLF